MALENPLGIVGERGQFLPGLKFPPSMPNASRKRFQEMCQQYMEGKNGGWDRLTDLADHANKFQFLALQTIIQYAYGKPIQPLANADGGELKGPLVILVKNYEDRAGELLPEPDMLTLTAATPILESISALLDDDTDTA